MLITFIAPFKSIAVGDLPNYGENNRINVLYSALKSDTKVRNLKVNRNTIAYEYDDIFATIEINETDTYLEYIVSENEREDRLYFPKNEIGNSIDNNYINKINYLENSDTRVYALGDPVWVKVGNTTLYTGIYEKEIRYATASLLVAWFSALLHPLVSFGISLAQTIISAFRSANSSSKTVYVYHDLYRDKNSFITYKEVFKFYKNKDKTGYITTETSIRTEANR